ncbi:MAG: NADH-quinone oxidoreductase subunit NuoK [Myxococcales bacterium]|nr:NADH-quinone oxidoreductase subunit NuoK [Myxococcales bacterium]
MSALSPYLFVSAFLFAAGIFAVLTRRNVIAILMGVELILNAAALQFVAMAHHVRPATGAPALGGDVFAIFIIVIAAAEAAVALAITLAVYQRFDAIDVDRVQDMKG